MNEIESQFLQLHIKYSKDIYKLLDAVVASGEAGLMFYLFYHKRNCSAGDFVDALGLTSGRVANILKTLEKKKYIVRKRDDEDKRKVMVALTEEGTKYIEQIYNENIEKHKLLLYGLGENDSKELIRLIEKIFHVLREEKLSYNLI